MTTIHDINVPLSKRGMIIGTTESGKSTLAVNLINDWAESYADSRTLVVDTKPHFKAQFSLSGIPMSFSRLYLTMKKGDLLPYSIRLPIGDGLTKYSLAKAWEIARTYTPRNRGLILVAQTNRLRDHGWLNQVILNHYESVSRWIYEFLYVDEMMVFLKNMTHRTGVFQTIVSGAELGIGFLGATQRPKWIPTEAISEMTLLYMFEMYYREDIKHLRDMGVPEDFEIPTEPWAFNHFNKSTKFSKKFMLQLPDLSKTREKVYIG